MLLKPPGKSLVHPDDRPLHGHLECDEGEDNSGCKNDRACAPESARRVQHAARHESSISDSVLSAECRVPSETKWKMEIARWEHISDFPPGRFCWDRGRSRGRKALSSSANPGYKKPSTTTTTSKSTSHVHAVREVTNCAGPSVSPLDLLAPSPRYPASGVDTNFRKSLNLQS